jgi:glutamine synthetase adenylyltransferase
MKLIKAIVRPNKVDDVDDTTRLRAGYEFLRSLETVLRIQSDSSRGWVSTDPVELGSVGARVGVEPATGETLLQCYREVTREVRDLFERGMTRLEAS